MTPAPRRSLRSLLVSVTIYHNPRCSNSRNALAVAGERGVDPTVVEYLATPPDRATLESIIGMLDDPVADLVRKDDRFKELGLDAAAYTEPGPVIDLLLEHPELLQRPIVVKDGTAIIGRPKERVEQFLS